MNSKNQFFIWSVVSPFLALATFLVMLTHPTILTPFYALILFLGLPICWYGKGYGWLISTSFLAFLLFFYAHSINEPLWNLGLAFSVILTLFIASRSFDEAITHVASDSVGIQKASEDFRIQLEQVENQYKGESLEFQKKFETVLSELNHYQEKTFSLEGLLEQAKNESAIAKHEAEQHKTQLSMMMHELETKAVNDEHLLEELLEKRKEVLDLKDRLEEAEKVNLSIQKIREEEKTTLESLSVKEERLMNEVLEERSVSLLLKDQILEFQEKIKDFNLVHDELENLREIQQGKDQEIFNLQFRLDSALEDIKKHESEITKSKNQELIQKKLCDAQNVQLEELRREKELLEISLSKLECLQTLEEEKNHLEDVLNHVMNDLNAIRTDYLKLEKEKEETTLVLQNLAHTQERSEDYALRRRAEGMYLQLRDQFNEKNDTLAETRQQLFHAQERLAQLELHVKEQEEYNVNPAVAALMKHILKMQKEFDQIEKSYLHEIGLLESLIGEHD